MREPEIRREIAAVAHHHQKPRQEDALPDMTSDMTMDMTILMQASRWGMISPQSKPFQA
ncbi:MAG: hypothetical protein O7E51_11580 [Acidobacteria bacterium]|nr:hypothetical protein [Acidobacteriota bacterium]